MGRKPTTNQESRQIQTPPTAEVIPKKRPSSDWRKPRMGFGDDAT